MKIHRRRYKSFLIMKFNYATLETCHTATGMVLVIDVLRAFSTAAYAFSRRAKAILLVSGVEKALILKTQIPNSKIMGEVGGLPPWGFDFGNSPTQIIEQELTGLTLIQRTGAGTQGAVRCVNADNLLAAPNQSMKVSAPKPRKLINGMKTARTRARCMAVP